MFNYITLKNENKASLETEVRFVIASATVDGNELVALAFADVDEAITQKTSSQIRRILSTLKKEGRVNFFVEFDNIENGTTESEFLKNKYLAFLTRRDNDAVIFVKI